MARKKSELESLMVNLREVDEKEYYGTYRDVQQKRGDSSDENASFFFYSGEKNVSLKMDEYEEVRREKKKQENELKNHFRAKKTRHILNKLKRSIFFFEDYLFEGCFDYIIKRIVQFGR